MSRSRQNINIELADGSKEQLESVRARNGMTQKEMVARLINWFCRQEHVVQQIILGQIPQEIAEDVAKMMLERIAEAGLVASAGGNGHAPAPASAPAGAHVFAAARARQRATHPSA